jgi:hypothetical protein
MACFRKRFSRDLQSNNTMEGDRLVNAAIRGFAAEAAPLLRKGQLKEARALKEATMEKIYDLFLSALAFRRRASLSNIPTTKAITSKRIDAEELLQEVRRRFDR